MSAAAGAAKGVQFVSARPGLLGGTAVALCLLVAGGLVEGLALGIAQGTAFSLRWPGLRRARYISITLVVAGLGWTAGSVPGVLAGDDGGPDPPLGLMLAGAAGIGLVMGPLLGAAQAWALRRTVAHPARWIVANAMAWPLTMVVIFYGASRPESDWSVLAVVAIGATTGAVAGAVLGVLTGLWLPSLDGQPIHNRVVLALVRSRRLGMDRSLVGLAVTGRRSGIIRKFPAQYVEDDSGMVVMPGQPESKTWWRNVRAAGTPVEALVDGRWEAATAYLLSPGDDGHAEAMALYRDRWPRTPLSNDQPVVRVVTAQHHARTPRGLNARSRRTTANRAP